MAKDKDYFIENLSLLLSSGMGISQALDALQPEMKSPQMKRVFQVMKTELDNGSPLWLALEKTAIVSPHVTSLIRVGEEAGRLAENLKVVSIEQQKERLLKSKIKSALMYPILVLSLTLIIGTGIAWFILPRLATVFAQLKLELPFITRALIGLGNFLGQYGSIAVPGFIIVVALAFYIVFFFKPTRSAGEWIIFHLPVVNRLIKEIELARFGYIFGTLLQAGLRVNQALSSLSEVSGFRAYRNLYSYLQQSIEDGNSFSKSFAEYPTIDMLIPAHVRGMISSGEKSGNLAETFLQFGTTYEEKTEVTTKNLTVLLEPVLLVIVWLGVVGVALAIIMPIYGLIGGLNR